jgi:hypothetical protein
VEGHLWSLWFSCCGEAFIPGFVTSCEAINWVDMCACTAWCTCQGVQVFLLNLLSFLPFQIYHRVIRILLDKASGVEVGKIVWRICWTPSCSCGSRSILRGGSEENHTTRGNWQWKKRCASSSSVPQTVQCSSIFTLYLPALSPTASALLISLQVNVFICGGRSLLRPGFLQNEISMMCNASGSL